MRFFLAVCTGLVLNGSGMDRLAAQHLHRHGDHFDLHQNVPHGHDGAGHLTDSLGHHIDGHGRHTGSIGVFENGAHGGPWQGHLPSFGPSSYHSSYYGSPYYGSQAYSYPYNNSAYYLSQMQRSQYYTPGYAAGSYGVPAYNNSLTIVPGTSIPTILGRSSVIFATPQISSGQALAPQTVAPSTSGQSGSIVANRIPIPDAGSNPSSIAGQSAGEIQLRNPRSSGGSVNYSLNEFQYTIQPGEVQKIPVDRGWNLRFDNGLGKSITLALEAGVNYEFSVSQQNGWTVAGNTSSATPTTPRAE